MASIGSTFKQRKRMALATLAVTAAMGAALPSAAQAFDLGLGAALSPDGLVLSAELTAYPPGCGGCTDVLAAQLALYPPGCGSCVSLTTSANRSYPNQCGSCRAASRRQAARRARAAHRQLRR